MQVVLAHGGTTSRQKDRVGTKPAARSGVAALASGALEAATQACRTLEDDERFHAGTGSTLRFDGWTIEMDAAVHCSDTRFGAVAAVEDVRNPVLVARALADLPNNLLVGAGAQAFARTLGMPPHDARTDKARKEWEEAVREVREGRARPDQFEWREADLRAHWNYTRPMSQVFPHAFPDAEQAPPVRRHSHHATGRVERHIIAPPGVLPASRGSRPARARGAVASPAPKGRLGGSGDTVGAVAFDGAEFAAAASTSGMTTALRGRAGDTVMPGCGILAAEEGAVACSGNGDHILRARLAARVLRWVEEGLSPKRAARKAVEMFPDKLDVAVALVTREGYALDANREVAWSATTAG